MGLENKDWRQEFRERLNDGGIFATQVPSDIFYLLRLSGSEKLLFNLLSIDQHTDAEESVKLRREAEQNGVQVIQLWEDIWINRPEQVLSRIKSVLGLNRRVHGRKTTIVPVNQETANSFFNRHHLQGTAGCKYRFGLELDNELLAVAGFSAKRPMNHTEGYNSVELIRFATIDGLTVTGGLSKLIRHFVQSAHPDDVMSYADQDWSDGNGYIRLGFSQVGETPPMQILLHKGTMERCLLHRLPAALQKDIEPMQEPERMSYLEKLNYTTVFNTGNLKYLLYL